jgi:hypothetical protein
VPPPLPQVTDVKTGDCHRADHLLEHALEALLEDAKNPPLAEEAKVSVCVCVGGGGAGVASALACPACNKLPLPQSRRLHARGGGGGGARAS